MTTQMRILELAAQAHSECWSHGPVVSVQTKKSQSACKRWQELVTGEFNERFKSEKPIGENETGQRIDLVDETDRVAYELKASRNNVHMEIYRDVFKALVFNRRKPCEALRTLVFIAPAEGIQRLTPTFLRDVQAIAAEMKLELVVEGI